MPCVKVVYALILCKDPTSPKTLIRPDVRDPFPCQHISDYLASHTHNSYHVRQTRWFDQELSVHGVGSHTPQDTFKPECGAAHSVSSSHHLRVYRGLYESEIVSDGYNVWRRW